MQISGGLFLYNSPLQNFVQQLPITSTLKFDLCHIHLARPLCSAWALPPSPLPVQYLNTIQAPWWFSEMYEQNG